MHGKIKKHKKIKKSIRISSFNHLFRILLFIYKKAEENKSPRLLYCYITSYFVYKKNAMLATKNTRSTNVQSFKCCLLTSTLIMQIYHSIENVTDTSASTSTCPGIIEVPASVLSAAITDISFILFVAVYATA